MKSYLKIGVFGLWMGMTVLPVCAASNNNISMVTYFPVPYAAYNNIYTTEKFDVGTQDGEFTLNLGNTGGCSNGTENQSSVSLMADKVFLRHITNASALSFDTDLYTPTAIFGNTTSSQAGTLSFNTDLRVGRNFGTNDVLVDTVNAENVVVENNVYLFSKAFSGYAALPQCNETVTWRQITTDTGTHWYLVCGEPTAPPACRWQAEPVMDCSPIPLSTDCYGEWAGGLWGNSSQWTIQCMGDTYSGVADPNNNNEVPGEYKMFLGALGAGIRGKRLCEQLSATAPTGAEDKAGQACENQDDYYFQYPDFSDSITCKTFRCQCGTTTVQTNYLWKVTKTGSGQVANNSSACANLRSLAGFGTDVTIATSETAVQNKTCNVSSLGQRQITCTDTGISSGTLATYSYKIWTCSKESHYQ